MQICEIETAQVDGPLWKFSVKCLLWALTDLKCLEIEWLSNENVDHVFSGVDFVSFVIEGGRQFLAMKMCSYLSL